MDETSPKEKSSPAFQFYASDTLSDRRFRLMTLAERGLFITMLSECWVNGTVPSDSRALSSLLGIEHDQMKSALTERVKSFFEEQGGELSNPELERYREYLAEKRRRQSEAGKRSAKALNSKPSAKRAAKPSAKPAAPEKSREEQSREEPRSLSEGFTPASDSNAEWLAGYESVEASEQRFR